MKLTLFIGILLIIGIVSISGCEQKTKTSDSKKLEIIVDSNLDDKLEYLWAVQGGGPDSSNDEADGIAIDSKSNVIVSGIFEKTADFSGRKLTSTGKGDIFVVKYNSNGKIIWIKQFGSIGVDNTFDLAVDNQDNILLSGGFENTVKFDSFSLTSKGKTDMFVAKLDPNGNVIWAKNFGSTQGDGGNEIFVDNNNDIIATAISVGDFSVEDTKFVNGGKRDSYIIKLNSNGNLIWAKAISGTGQGRIRAIAADGQNNVLAGFQFRDQLKVENEIFDSLGDWDGLAVKFDSNGNLQWTKHYGGPGLDNVRGIGGDKDGNVYATGVFNTNTYLSKFDSEGNLIWENKISSSSEDTGAEIVVSSDGESYLSGAIFDEMTISSQNFEDIKIKASNDVEPYLLKFDNEGKLISYFKPTESDSSSGGGTLDLNSNNVALVIKFRGKLNIENDQFSTSGDKDFAIVLLSFRE